MMIKIKVINNSKYDLPQYATDQSAALDLIANLDSPLTLDSLDRTIVPTGISIQLPKGYEAQVRPRSGLAAKHGISLLNTPGTVDADYRGEIGVIMINLSKDSYTINPGDRIAQMLVAKHEIVEWELVDKLDDTARGAGGFGHTGKR